jgi:hypothetical protein
MKRPSYILLPGLGDQKPIFGWFYRRVEKLWRRSGVDAQVCQMNWISDESFESKLARVKRVIEAERRKGREVVVVGASAGAAIGMVAAHEQGTRFVSICGLLKLKADDYRNPAYTHTSWFRAAEAAERVIAGLGQAEKKRVLTLTPSIDKVIEPERERIDGAENITMRVKGHLAGIVLGLVVYRKQITRFVTSKDLE